MKNIEPIETRSQVCRPISLTNFNRWLRRACLPAVAMAFAAFHSLAQTNVLTQHNDNGRTGQNTTETPTFVGIPSHFRAEDLGL